VFYDYRPGTGPTLVFLHYWGGSARTWEPVIARLAGRSTLSLDFRGWGRSGALPGPYTLEQFADDVTDVINQCGLTDYVLVGHSMGGKVAQLIASRNPDGLSRLVLVGSGPAHPADVITPDYQARLSHAYDNAESVSGVRDHVLTATALDQALKTQVVEDSLAGGLPAREEWPLRGIAQDITAEARRIEVPTLVLAGEHDQVEPIDVLKNNLVPYIADASFAVIEGSGHLIPLEAPARLAGVIAQFVARA
jgi:pimeloyl-ACP methyl ester carboxylesterase